VSHLIAGVGLASDQELDESEGMSSKNGKN